MLQNQLILCPIIWEFPQIAKARYVVCLDTSNNTTHEHLVALQYEIALVIDART